MYNVEKEWTWAVGNAFMNEVSIHGRVFVQPTGVLAHLGIVAWDLPIVSLHLLERSSLHVPWTCAFALELMHRACDVEDRHLHYWTDFTTGINSSFLAYDPRGDTFVARLVVVTPSPRRSGVVGRVGSAPRSSRKKRYRDLDSEPAPYGLAGAIPAHEAPAAMGVHGSPASPSVPPVPPLHTTPTYAPTDGTPVRRMTVERSDIRAIPMLIRALGDEGDHSWQVECILSTLASCYLPRSEEACRIEADRASDTSELSRVQTELTALRESLRQQGILLERATSERDRYRGERNALREAPAPAAPSFNARSATERRDPYEVFESGPSARGGRFPYTEHAHHYAQPHPSAMPSFDERVSKTPPHPGYCP